MNVPAPETRPEEPQLTRRVAVRRALALRCPHCGESKLFYKLLRMHERCAACGLKYEREPGYFLGSIYINYGLTVVLVTVGYLALMFGTDIPPKSILTPLTIFCIVFPVWFFRYARSLWIAFDLVWDPPGKEHFRK